jgi:hypothetical protein
MAKSEPSPGRPVNHKLSHSHGGLVCGMHPTRAAVPFGSLPRYRADGFCKRATHPPPEATAKVEAVKPLLDASPDYQSVARLRLPAIYQWPESAEDGGLLAYGREGCCATGML